MDLVVLDYGHSRDLVAVAKTFHKVCAVTVVYLNDNGEDTGNDLLNKVHIPLFKSFRKNGVVGVCKGIGKNQLGVILMKVRDEFSSTMLSATYKNVSVFSIANSKKYRVVIDMTGEDSVASHYISGILYYAWRDTCMNYMSLDKFFESIVWLDIVNLNSLYNRNGNDLFYFYNFMDEYMRFKAENNIRIGKLYKENADA